MSRLVRGIIIVAAGSTCYWCYRPLALYPVRDGHQHRVVFDFDHVTVTDKTKVFDISKVISRAHSSHFRWRQYDVFMAELGKTVPSCGMSLPPSSAPSVPLAPSLPLAAPCPSICLSVPLAV